MLKRLLFCLCIVLVAQEAGAQMRLSKVIRRKTAEAALTLNGGFYGGTYYSVGTSIHYMWGLGRKRQTSSIGFGVRHNTFFANNREYTTSDKKYYEVLLGGKDSVRFKKMNSNLLSTYLATQIHIKRGVDLGINFDLFGITFGGTQKANFHSYELTLGKDQPINVKPFAFNINDLATDQYGYGSSLNQIYLNFRGGRIMRYRLGFDYFINEIETQVPITGNGFRFRNNNVMLSGAISWNIRHNKEYTNIWNFKEKMNR
jgi:hypothetical protein